MLISSHIKYLVLFIFTMPVKPTLMADLRRIGNSSPLNNHRSQLGNGNYNRFDVLSQRPRLPSTGKRQLSPGASAPPSFKFPRLDSNKMFEKLQGQDEFLTAAKAGIELANKAIGSACKPDDAGIGTALFQLSSALSNLISGNEALKSSIIDIFKANSVAGPPPPPPQDPQRLAPGTEIFPLRLSGQRDPGGRGTGSGGHPHR